MAIIKTKPGKVARSLSLLAVACIAGLSLSGCIAPEEPKAGPAAANSYELSLDKLPADANEPVVVWADAVRQAGLEAYKADNPEVKIEVQIVPTDQILTKIQLANRAGSGWPDMVFVEEGTLPALASKQFDNFAQPLNGLVDEKTISGFGTALDPCTIDGALYCLRNDVAPDVMYYNTKGLEEVGATVPVTFEELDALVGELAANHPDYKMQIHGSDFRGFFHTYGASQCPYAELSGLNDLTIDMSDPRCVRASELLDHMVSSKVLVTDALSPEQLKAMGSKMLISIGAVWRSAGLGEMLGYEEGTLGVAKVPAWDGDEANSGVWTEGGSGWAVSRHAKNMKGALDLATYMSTDSKWLNSTITFPAYQPAQAEWLSLNVLDKPTFADPKAAAEAFGDSASRITTVVPWLRFKAPAEFPVADVQAGKSIVDEVADSFVTRLSNAAKAAGYNVTPAK